MKTLSASLLFIFLLTFSAYSQEYYKEKKDTTVTETQKTPKRQSTVQEDEVSFAQRLRFGGNLGLGFNPFYIDAAPSIGYVVSSKFMAGVGIRYLYVKYEDNFYGDFSYSSYGGSLWANYFLLDNIFLRSEFESLRVDFIEDNRKQREWVPSLFLGGGYLQPIGRTGSGVFLSVMYNVLHDDLKSPYGSPLVVRAGIML
ncbi:hypothetical protein [Marinigracilibium pacificum]|uniref:Outer membrane protein with beta-barrel domain n=1 Tax=Marinigracilibium pacificum TaxID=2729599 RepID=A0A848IY18_9BACT|nr:hypothetical protein [Marinigracilibium pacificum]NMM49403.1 hypothetical protein [Marinigracilibium pacificum]